MDNFNEIKLLDPPGAKSIDWFDQHYYLVNREGEDVYYPSVTTILQVVPKPFLGKWRGDIGNEEADRKKSEGQARGSAVHEGCQTLAEGGCVLFSSPKDPISQAEYDEAVFEYDKVYVVYEQEWALQIYRFGKWLEAVQPKILGIEKTVFNNSHRFAGTLDYLFEIEEGSYPVNGSKPVKIPGGIYIADLKSSNFLSPDVFMQISAYGAAVREMGLTNIKGGIVIHTNAATRSGIEGLGTKVMDTEYMDEEFRSFLKFYEVWKINPYPSKPKLIQLPKLITSPIKKGVEV